MEKAYCKDALTTLKTTLSYNQNQSVHVAFFILFGSNYSMRILLENTSDDFLKIPEPPTYETIKFDIETEPFYNLVQWNLEQLNRPYDIFGACSLLLKPLYEYKPQYPIKSLFCSQAVMHMFKHVLKFDADGENVDNMLPDDVYSFLHRIKVGESTEKKDAE